MSPVGPAASSFRGSASIGLRPREAGAWPQYWHSPGDRSPSDARTPRSRTGRAGRTPAYRRATGAPAASSPPATATTAESVVGQALWPANRSLYSFSRPRPLGNELHAKDSAAFQPVFRPSEAVVARPIQRPLVHAGVDPSRGCRVERHTPDGWRGKARVPKLPGLAAVLRDGDARTPTGHCDAVCGGWIEGNVVQIPAHPQIPIYFKANSAVRRYEQPASLGRREPVTRIMRRLFDVQHLKAGRSGEPPLLAAIFAAEDSLFVPGHQNSATPPVHANRRGVFPPQAEAGVVPRAAPVMRDLNARGVTEVDGAGSIAVYRNVEQLGDIAAGQDLPSFAAFRDSQQSVPRGDIDGGRVHRVIIERGQKRKIEPHVAPGPRVRFPEDAARGKFGPHHISLGGHRTGVERILTGDGQRQHRQNEQPPHVELL